MSTFLILVGFLGFVVGIVLFGISLFKKLPKKKPLYVLVGGFIVMIIGGSLGVSQPAGNSAPVPSTSPAPVVSSSLVSVSEPTQNVSYANKESITVADTTSYCFAVDVADYDGDIVAAGKYNFYPDLVDRFDVGEMLKDETPIVWDVYVSPNLYSSLSKLQDGEFITTIGGINKDSSVIDLPSNSYVYVKYNDVVGEPIGVLQIDPTK